MLSLGIGQCQRIKLQNGRAVLLKEELAPLMVSKVSNEMLEESLGSEAESPYDADNRLDCAFPLAVYSSPTISSASWKWIRFSFCVRETWIKCRVGPGEGSAIKLFLPPLLLHNLCLNALKPEMTLRLAEFPDYYCADPLPLLFPVAKELYLVPLQDFPRELSPSALDEACKSFLFKDKVVLALGDTVVVAVPTNADQFFSVALRVQRADGVVGDTQFLLSSGSNVYIKQIPLESDRLPPRLQQALKRSAAFPQPLLFKTWPRFVRLTEIFAHTKVPSGLLQRVLVYGPYGSGKRTLVQRVADDMGVSVGLVSLYADQRFEKIRHSQDIHNVSAYLKEVLLEHPASHALLLDGLELLDRKLKLSAVLEDVFEGSEKLLLASYSYPMNRDAVALSEEHLRVFDVVKHLRSPNRRARLRLFKELIEYLPCEPPFSPHDLDGFTLAEFSELAQILLSSKEPLHQAWLAYKSTLQMRRKLRASCSEIPQVTWDEVAGLEEAKAVLRTLLCPGSLSTGIILHGPPGTGKTLLAKALATESRFSFLPVKGPELLNPYIGESEASLRGVFAQARAMAPCILFFDEIDALVPKRGDFGDSVGVADRLVSTFMTEMDKISVLNPLRISEIGEDSDSDVCDTELIFVIGATNRLDLIDPALLRPGRFDHSIFLGPPKDVEEQAAVLKATCLKYRMAEDIDFRSVFDALARCNQGPALLSAAEIALIAETAVRNVLETKIQELGVLSLNEDFPVSDASLLIKPIAVENLTDAAIALYSPINSSST